MLSSAESDSLLLLDFLYFLSSDKSYSLDDESAYDGSDSGSSGTYYFPTFALRFDDFVGCVSGLGYGIFVPTGVKSKCGILDFGLFVPKGVKSKGSQLIEMFWCSN